MEINRMIALYMGYCQSRQLREKTMLSYGNYVAMVGKNENRIAEHVKNQLKEDELGEQIKMPLNGMFTGGK